MKRLVYNAIRTPDGTTLVSRHVHDYVTYKDENGKVYSIDGGLSYTHNDIHPDAPFEDLRVYDDAPFERIREVLAWGTFGKDGKQQRKYVPISKLSNDHIHNIINENHGSKWFRGFLTKELEYRKNNEIVIED